MNDLLLSNWFNGMSDAEIVHQIRSDAAENHNGFDPIITELFCAHIAALQCDWKYVQAKVSALKELVVRELEGRPGLFPLCYYPVELSAGESRRIAKLRACSLALRINPADLSTQKRYIEKKKKILKIGYVSVDFRSHSGSLSLSGFLKSHNRDRYEIRGYSIAPSWGGDRVRNEYSSIFDSFVYIGDLTDLDAARRIYKDGIDILVDTSRHILGWRPGIFAYRPAPVQVSAWGYGGTSGCEFIDYLLVDKWMTSKGEREESLEAVRILPQYHPCALHEYESGRLARRDVGLPDDVYVFANFNNHYKLSHELFTVWMEILRNVDNSVLWLIDGEKTARRNLLETAGELGISGARIIFADRVGRERHLARMELADCILDNPRLGGGSSIIDSLIAGTPAVSYAGQNMTDKCGQSILQSAGLANMVADDLDNYRDLAIRMAIIDKCQARDLTVEARTQSSVFNMEKFARNVEKSYECMWSELQPDDIRF